MDLPMEQQVSKELFKNVTDQILERLESFEKKFDRFWTKTEAIDRDLNQINLTMAKQNVESLQEQIKDLDAKVEALETFKTKVLTGLIVAQIVISLVVAGLNFYLRVK